MTAHISTSELQQAAAAQPGAQVGPNAVLQTATALRTLVGEAECRAVFARAGLVHHLDLPPSRMLPQDEAAQLFAAILEHFPTEDAKRILHEAGRLTGEYILANRIPELARTILPRLPVFLSSRLLMQAIARHAWTFAGSGAVTISLRWPVSIRIGNNPLATPGCPWHLAVFETLFRNLVSANTVFIHTDCCCHGTSCRSEFRLRSHS